MNPQSSFDIFCWVSGQVIVYAIGAVLAIFVLTGMLGGVLYLFDGMKRIIRKRGTP